ncbi:PepSY domain-containing protein [Methylococcus geothermalis]|uniref:Beta-lactamase-inhibitor-like PepSY-like domain-containing protein n=1 Tax=Methylococcus geothermalis TaxID=2681310 RepID=A0A858QA08_9GAMM|nr:PepSY-like domain-containing protein [Methylococcus geothermalis]QJD30709.1 hypothetical protein GNH96_12460 [Methylococcus geothermalis]
MNRKLSHALVWVCVLVSSAGTLADDKNLTEQQVPKPVLDTFKAVYPNATDIEYEEKVKHGQTVYEIEFKDKGVEREIVYSADGKVLKSEWDD